MISLLLALLIVSPPRPVVKPPPLLKCLDMCRGGWCFYELATRCELECTFRNCRPLRVILGEWDPVPTEYQPEPYDTTVYGTDSNWFDSHLTDPVEPATPPKDSGTIEGYPGGFGHPGLGEAP